MSTARKKTTVYLDPDLLRAVKVLAASSGRHDYEVVEEALSQYVDSAMADARRQALRDLLSELGGDAEPTDDAALSLAYAELHAARHDRRPK
jgi:predicted transcriptional regulator